MSGHPNPILDCCIPWCVKNHETALFQQCDSASSPQSSASSTRSHLRMNLWFPTADLVQSMSFGGADCRRILADQQCRGSYHHGGLDDQNTWIRRWSVPKRIHGNKMAYNGNDISQDEALGAVSVVLQLYRHRSCSILNEALCTAMSFWCVVWWIVGLFGRPVSFCMSCVRAPCTWGLFCVFCALFRLPNVR